MLTRCTMLLPLLFSFCVALFINTFGQRALAGQHTGPPENPTPESFWPTNPTDWITNEAQLGLPDAPLVFSGDALRIGADLSTLRPVSIDQDARIEVGATARFELAGTVSGLDGSSSSLIKDGTGTLVLSGPNDYLGHTRLRAGRLQIQGSTALGAGTSSLWMSPGTTLSYAPDTVLRKSIQLDATPPASSDDPQVHVDPALRIPRAHAARQSASAEQAARLHVSSGTATQAAMITGLMPLRKTGAGTLVFADPVHSAGLDIEAGTVRSTMMLVTPVAVHSGARLEGTGSIGATTVHGGATLAPGSEALGVMMVTGDLTLLPDAQVELRATPDGKADWIRVVGKAALDGRLTALAQAGDWQPSTEYEVVHALGGLNGTRFESADTNLAFLDPKISYSEDDTRVRLTLARNDLGMDDVGDGDNEDEVAVVIDPPVTPVTPVVPVTPVTPVTPVDPVNPLDPTTPVAPLDPGPPVLPDVDIPVDDPVVIVVDSDDGEDEVVEVAVEEPRPIDEPETILHDAVVVMTASDAREAFRQLSGSWHASLRAGMIEDSRFIREAALHQLAQGDRHWAHAWHSNGWRSAVDGTPADWRDIHGMALGTTRSLPANWHATAFLGTQRSQWRRHHAMASARIDGIHAGIALLKEMTVVDAAIGLAKTWNRVKASRTVSVGTLQHALDGVGHGYTLQLFTEWAVPLRKFAQLYRHSVLQSVTPFVRAAWVRDRLDSYDESGGAPALTMLPDDRSVWFTALGLKADHAIDGPAGKMRLQGEVAWRYAGGDINAKSRQQFRDSTEKRVFSSEGQPIARQAWALKLGVEGELSRDIRLRVAYAGQYATRQKDHGVSLNVAWTF